MKFPDSTNNPYVVQEQIGINTNSLPSAIKIVLVSSEVYVRNMRSRMPFKFGKTVMTGMPVLHLRAFFRDENGAEFQGWSACGLVSMWFDKDYSKPESQRESDLVRAVAEALKAYSTCPPCTAWELHSRGDFEARVALGRYGLNSLASGFGPSLVDAAMIDGICRHTGVTFFECLQQNLLGLPFDMATILPAAPCTKVALRHTIGLGDPLTNIDITEPINDGLPESLEQVIATYKPRYFKIKVNNNAGESLDRLRRIKSILDPLVPDYHVTLDGNEAFPTMDDFEQFFDAVRTDNTLAVFWERILWVEQPVARNQALEPAVKDALRRMSAHKKIIIDESDGEDSAFERALDLGYGGISAKNCKGVFRTLQSYAQITKLPSSSGVVLSSEDLTNQPLLPNQQDLCVAAALGITHSERNGHHFFKGFDFIPAAEQVQALIDYAGLYEMTPDGKLSLRISDGDIDVSSVNGAIGLGVTSEPDWLSMEPVQLPQV